jgi:Isochorismatase family
MPTPRDFVIVEPTVSDLRIGNFQNIEYATLDMAKHLAMVERDAKDGKTFAESRDVAATFGKNHRDVLAAIRDLIEKVGEMICKFLRRSILRTLGGVHSPVTSSQFRGVMELISPLAALCPPATVIDKRGYSRFAEPRLIEHLRQRGADGLIVSGSETDVCVLATVPDAVDIGYRVKGCPSAPLLHNRTSWANCTVSSLGPLS